MAKFIWQLGVFHLLAWVYHRWLRPHDFTTDDLRLYAINALVALPLFLLLEWAWRAYKRRRARRRFLAWFENVDEHIRAQLARGVESRAELERRFEERAGGDCEASDH